MNCLHCGKKLNTESEIRCGWHTKCVRNFFHSSSLPEIDLNEDSLNLLVKKAIKKHLTIPGVQKKLSLHLSKEDKYRLTVVDYPTGYILKPQTDVFRHLPEYEHVTMLMADLVGIQTVPHALVRLNDGYAYITKRVDRKFEKNQAYKYAMEDFCQLSGRLTSDKYKGSYEQCGKLILRFSEAPGFDLTEFYLRLVFCFITGNSDMHLKNFSLREDAPASRSFHLAPAYDLLPVNLVLPEDTEQTALMLNGKKKNIKKKDFFAFGEYIGLSDKVTRSLIRMVCDQEPQLIKMCKESLLTYEEQEGYNELIKKRVAVFD